MVGEVPKLVIVRERLRELLTDDYYRLMRELKSEIKRLRELRHRRLIVITGSDSIKIAGLATEIVSRYVKIFKRERQGKVRILYVFHDEFPEARIREKIFKRVMKKLHREYIDMTISVYEGSEKFLGTTFDVLIMDLIDDLKPNDVGRLMGIVEGGGLIIFLTPPFKEWITKKTIFKQNLTVPQYPEPRHVFIKWFIRKLMEHKGIYIFDVDKGKLVKSGMVKYKSRSVKIKELKIPQKTVFPKELYELALTQDQIEVIKLIEANFIERPKRGRVSFVVIADRGRGKSCSVGIAIVGLVKELLKYKNRVRIGVTAPEPLNVQSMFDLIMKTLDKLKTKYKVIRRRDFVIEVKGDRFSIEYWPPIDIPRLGVDIAVVDEAAGISVPLLHKIWLNHKRTIFSTTIHGYEGAGRGFSVRFMKRLKEDPATKLITYEMTEPIRYAIDDPIEAFQFDALLLNAEPDELSEEDLNYIREGAFEYLKLDPDFLFSPKGEDLLRSLFGIYVLAHYRNQPDDLGMLADAPHHSIRAVRIPSGKVVAAVQLAEEGPIPEDYIDELLKGGKIPGNILPDRLLKHWRLRDYAYGRGWRIVRIAVHPQVQGKGIGSWVLKKLERESIERGYDWIGSGFGVNRELLNFWVKNGFIPVHISPDRNPVSGEFTVLVIKPLNPKWEVLVKIASSEFRTKLLNSLHDVYRFLESDVALLLLKSSCDELPQLKISLSPIQLDRLKNYCLGPTTYEAVCDAVMILTKYYWASRCEERPKLSRKHELLLIMKVLQGRSWGEVAEELGVRKEALTSE
ncbi:MAG: ATPase, partial [Desulfurococcales archaeon ex4484_42]